MITWCWQLLFSVNTTHSHVINQQDSLIIELLISSKNQRIILFDCTCFSPWFLSFPPTENCFLSSGDESFHQGNEYWLSWLLNCSWIQLDQSFTTLQTQYTTGFGKHSYLYIHNTPHWELYILIKRVTVLTVSLHSWLGTVPCISFFDLYSSVDTTTVHQTTLHRLNYPPPLFFKWIRCVVDSQPPNTSHWQPSSSHDLQHILSIFWFC